MTSSHIQRIGVKGSTSDFESEGVSSSLTFAATGAIGFISHFSFLNKRGGKLPLDIKINCLMAFDIEGAVTTANN